MAKSTFRGEIMTPGSGRIAISGPERTGAFLGAGRLARGSGLSVRTGTGVFGGESPHHIDVYEPPAS